MSKHISVPPQQLLERILTLEIVRVTERAAVSAARLRGHGNEKAADQAAVDAMRRELNKIPIEGTIVIGENVRISTVAIAQGNLTVRITETPQVSQPNPLSETGTTVIVPRTQIDVDTDAENRLGIVRESVSLQDLVQGLNALGVGPRDMISILQAIEAAGALQATIELI